METIKHMLLQHNKKMESFNFNFINEERMLELNQNYLHHDTFTDVITFDYSTNSAVSGECYICLDRAHENAQKHSQSLENELLRLVFHAVLHCLGFPDKTEEEKRIMREQENHFLQLFHVKHK